MLFCVTRPAWESDKSEGRGAVRCLPLGAGVDLLGVGRWGRKSGLEAMSGVLVVLDWKSGGAEATFCVREGLCENMRLV